MKNCSRMTFDVHNHYCSLFTQLLNFLFPSIIIYSTSLNFLAHSAHNSAHFPIFNQVLKCYKSSIQVIYLAFTHMVLIFTIHNYKATNCLTKTETFLETFLHITEPLLQCDKAKHILTHDRFNQYSPVMCHIVC